MSLLYLLKDSFERGFAQNEQVRCCNAEPLRAHFDLPLRLLAGHVEASQTRLTDRGKGLEKQSRFSDTGVAADENDRTGNETAAQYPIELADA